MSEPGTRRSHEVLAIGLVSMAHFFSHFYILVVPALLPLIKADLGAESAFVLFGLIMTAYAGMSAAGQYPAGVVMDRYGARPFIIFGLIGISACMFLMGFADSVAVLIVLAAVAGLCDSQFHPSDYTIMTARVRGPWRGKAYAIHTSAGFLGFAATPTVVSFLAPNFHWREIMHILGIAGMIGAVSLIVFARFLDDREFAAPAAEADAGGTGAGKSFIFTTPIVLMFGFYVATALSGNGIQTFGIPAMIEMFEIDLVAANQTLAIYLWGITIGVFAGGMVTTWLKRFDAIAAVGYSLSAAVLVLVGMSVMPVGGVVVGLAFVGFMIGAVMPSRDLMVASIAPAGATGKAFGFVSTGFSVGGFFGPVLYGSIMDQNAP
ncbi:MAG: MFS transporter, partial [Rhodospirillales bacterium]|nr:MFS transporter [Rhodospirillales bacterium]